MDRHFRCTACGKCCFGWLPLTVADALAHAGRFPLAVVWTPVKPASKAYALTTRLGVSLPSKERKPPAIRITPMGYIPPAVPCPALRQDGMCSIHDNKPSRCRTMPFFPYQEEADQAQLLIPRPGWQCDISANAPLAYQDKAILHRQDFEREQGELLKQAPILRTYAAKVLSQVGGLRGMLEQAAKKPGGGHVALSFASLLRCLPEVDKSAIAQAQLPILQHYRGLAQDAPGLAEYYRNYDDWTWEMERLI